MGILCLCIRVYLSYMHLPRIQLSRQKAIIGLIAGFLAVATCIVLWSALSKPPVDTSNSPAAQEVIEDTNLAATQLVDKGDIDGAFDYFDQSIKESEGDNGTKSSLLLGKANLARQTGRYDTAIEAAKQAEEIESNATTTEALATSYELQGDKDNALKYYEKLIEQTPEDSPGYRYRAIWEAKVKELQQ